MGEVSFIGFRAMDALTSVNRIHVVSGTFYLITPQLWHLKPYKDEL